MSGGSESSLLTVPSSLHFHQAPSTASNSAWAVIAASPMSGINCGFVTMYCTKSLVSPGSSER
jgi:hypothetical protein